ncbi:MAG TPA: choice-of-anchor tandem repeat GloVer-containing protein, partial [Opitutaceae bacterium]|nr:choice-of-anchor tandem repeat GloVer-containing protein [Opitutaceae bacterium]
MKPLVTALLQSLRAIGCVLVASLSTASSHAQKFEVLHEWQGPEDGYYGRSGVIEVAPGVFMGVTSSGGLYGAGAVFKVNGDGSGYGILHYFDAVDMWFELSPLCKASNNRVYGTTQIGGLNGLGIVYSVAADGSDFTVVHNFAVSDGWATPGGLMQASDGRLYGLASRGGFNSGGTIYSLNLDGSGFSVIHHMPSNSGFAHNPALLESPNGTLVGALVQGGVDGYGVLFSVQLDGSNFQVIRDLSPTAGAFLQDLILGPDGRLYGITNLGGANNYGSIFAVNRDGTGFIVLRELTDYLDYRDAKLATGGGRLFGAGPSNSSSMFSLNLDGSGYSTFFVEGSGPTGRLTIGLDGRVYGIRKPNGPYV